jgi:hypothetical protein
MSFTRASNATRVASNGLIEKVRTNLILQSQTFQTTWVPVRASVSADTTTAPDGTTSAETLFDSVDNNIHYVQQNFSAATGPATISVFAKANQLSQIQLVAAGGTTPMGRGFDLSTGTTFTESVGGVSSNDLGQSITAVGNGWYRCTISWTATGQNAFWILTSSGNAATYAGTGTDGVFIWGAQLETGDIATDYIATTSAAVSVGPVSGLPRLDYLNSTCPRLLLEPQRSNFVTFSEQLNNAAWLKSGVTLTSNNAISPSGYQDADLMTYSSAGSRVMSQLFVVSATSLAVSVYVKGVSGNGANFLVFDSTASSVKGDVSFTGNTFTPASSSFSAKSESVGNGWYRISMVVPIVSGNNNRLYLYTDSNGGTISGSSLLAWGFQAEAASYPSSYIPTLGTSVTRVADAASKTGISSLIGQTEGTVFLEIETLPQSGDFFTITPASGSFYSNGMGIGFFSGTLRFQLYSSTNISSILGVISGKNKIALAYKSGNTSIYINGVSVFTSSTTFSFSVALSGLTLQSAATISGAISQSRSNQFLLFPTRLTNAQLAELTA